MAAKLEKSRRAFAGMHGLVKSLDTEAAAVVAVLAVPAALYILKLLVILGFFLPANEVSWWGIHQFSDFLSMMGGKRFAEEGFIRHYFTMNTTVGPYELARGWQTYQVPQLVHESAVYYTHYGSLDAFVVGLIFKIQSWLPIKQVYSIKLLYLIFTTLSFTALSLWLVAVRLRFGTIVALVCALFLTPSVFFLTVAESPTAESLSLSLTFLLMAAFIFAERVAMPARIKYALYGFVWLCGFLQANNNPQFLPFMGIFMTAYALLYWKFTWRNALIWAALCSGPVVGFFIHLVLWWWTLGGWHNFVQDLVAALHRRTHDFESGVEIDFRRFTVSDAPAYLSGFLFEVQSLSAGQWALMIVSPPIMIYLGRLHDAKSRLREWALALSMLFGSFLFVVVFVEAAVTQPLDILKTLMPGAAVLLGLTVRETVALWQSRRRGLAAIGAAACIVTVGPPLLFNAQGRTLTEALGGSVIKGIGPNYLGMPVGEVQRTAKFIAENTRYGDIVFVGFGTGETGHIEYPNPAWEFLSDRQIRVLDAVESWQMQMASIAKAIEGLPASSKAKSARFFVLVPEAVDMAPVVRRFLKSSARRVAGLEASAKVPGSVLLTLYAVDEAKIGLPAKSTVIEPPAPDTSWTNAIALDLTSSIPRQKGDLWDLGQRWMMSHTPMPSLFHHPRTGYLHLYSTVDRHVSLRDFSSKFRSFVGTTLEAKLFVDRARRNHLDSAILAINDELYELKLSFSGDYVSVNNRNEFVMRTALPDVSKPVTLRLALLNGRGYVYLDGKPLGEGIPLSPAKKGETGVILGNLSPPNVKETVALDVDYMAYSNHGAFEPNGRNIADERPSPFRGPDEVTPWDSLGEHVDGWALRHVKTGGETIAFDTAKLQQQAFLEASVPKFDNAGGSTLALRAKIENRPFENRLGAMMLLRDGVRELSISFLHDRVGVFDGPNEIAAIPNGEVRSGFVTYRLALIRDCGYVYVDDRLAYSVKLSTGTTRKDIQVGDFIPFGSHYLVAEVEKLALSSKGAFGPDGKRLEPAPGNAESCVISNRN